MTNSQKIIFTLSILVIIALLAFLYISNTNTPSSISVPQPLPEAPVTIATSTVATTTIDIKTPPKPKPAAPAPVVTKKCYIGGCSGQICSDQEGMVSNCMYREEYACYKTATCEVQKTGECGWTETDELKACLVNAE